jgi:6,7-dimethyl-8-ribityllumazine synthase
MATINHNLSDYDIKSVPNATGMKIGIVVAEWNENITGAMLEGAKQTLMRNGVFPEDINVLTVPGSFELVYGAAQMVKTGVDAVIAIGCVIRGETPHDRYICQGVTAGLAQLNAAQDVPVIYGLITTLDMQQAEDRAGGKLGNKGDECAVTAIKMVDFKRKLAQG